MNHKRTTIKAARSAVKRARTASNKKANFTCKDGLQGEIEVTEQGLKVWLNEDELGTFTAQDQVYQAINGYEVTEVEEEEEGTPEEEQQLVSDPYDVSKVRTKQTPVTVEQLVNRINKGDVNFTPDFQRKPDVWSRAKKSRLIESFMSDLHVPSLCLDEDDEGQWKPIDGLQRLCAIRSFLCSEKPMKLKGLDHYTDFEGKTFDELPRKYQLRVLNYRMWCTVVEPPTPLEFKIMLFFRLNSGSQQVNAQEVRNACMSGKGRDMINAVADSDAFVNATNGKVKTIRMQDRQAVLRCAVFMANSVDEYRGKMASTMTSTLKRLNEMSTAELIDIKSDLTNGFVRAQKLLGDDAFRKVYLKKERKQPINLALMEVQVSQLGKLTEKQFKALDGKKVVDALIELIDDDEAFVDAISKATADPARTQDRHRVFANVLKSSTKAKGGK